MFKIEGLDKLQKELADAQRAMEDVNGELGSVTFNPEDPGSIEAAIAAAHKLIEDKLGPYANNSIVGPMIDGLKEQYREGILEKATAARLENDEE